jgi:cysteine desulfurase / selenocysteine lyase
VLHFNSSGSSLMPQPVWDAVVNHTTLEAAIGGYEAVTEASEQIEAAYDAIAHLIDCNRNEVAIVENATRAWNMAFFSIPLKPGDTVLACQAEYATNYVSLLHAAKTKGISIEVIPSDDAGQISLEALENAITPSVKLITMTHVPNNGGLVNPAIEVGHIAKQSNILYLLDACQSVGQMPINVKEIGCDFLSTSGRKFLRGPRGTGFLYMSEAALQNAEVSLLDLHSATWTACEQYEPRPDIRRFESWETNFAAKIGLGVAVSYASQVGIEKIWERIQMLTPILRSELSKIPGLTIHDQGAIKCGIVSFSVDGIDPQSICDALASYRMNVSHTPQQYTRLDMEPRNLTDLVRASIHYFNTEEEIERFCHVLAELLKNH